MSCVGESSVYNGYAKDHFILHYGSHHRLQAARTSPKCPPCTLCRNEIPQGMTVRVDPAPGFTTLAHDRLPNEHGISLVIGNCKNPNKNPEAERAIAELGSERVILPPQGGPVSTVTLALAVASP